MNSAFIELKKHHNKINIVDIGAARAAFLFELSKVFELSNVFSVGIDPLNHGISNQYSKFLNVCVDNIPRKTEETKTFYVNSIDQASSLCILTADNLSSEKKEDKVYYTEDIIKKLTTIVDTIDVKVLNLSDIIDDEVEGIIHFVKIDAEGKDMDIVKSLKPNFHRIKYISIECTNEIPRFEGEVNRKEFIEYFEENNFKVFDLIDYEFQDNNGTQMSDIVFVNQKEL
jgi:hypothetical protein